LGRFHFIGSQQFPLETRAMKLKGEIDAAWKEDHRRLDNGRLVYRKLALALAHPVSREWKG
jgi:hypothetical protein